MQSNLDQGLPYHTYVIPKRRDLKNAVGLACGDLLRPKERVIHKFVKIGLETASASQEGGQRVVLQRGSQRLTNNITEVVERVVMQIEVQ